tara:strand:+ start:5272 stop:7980 length:2709 start_codon:yes stop_codon:yes gene_type:complete
MATFNKYLSKFRVGKGERCSHLGMAHTKGRFYIPPEDLDVFSAKYYKHVFVENGSCDLIERHGDLCCILYDLDFRIDKNSKERAYTEDSLVQFLEIVTRIISKYIDAPVSAYDAFVCEKETATIKKEWKKDGVHIMFPYIVTEPAVQHLIREEVMVEAKHIFPYAMNSIEDIIDKAVLDTNGWMMYGASKQEGKPYILTGIWQYENEDDIGRINPSRVATSQFYKASKELIGLLSIRRFTQADLASFRPEQQDIVENWIEDFNTQRAERDNIHSRKFHGEIGRKGYVVDLKTVQALVSILDSSRAASYNSWIELGFCLHNINDSLLECWIEFSERDNNYVSTARNDCSTRWLQMQDRGLALGTLHMWAKKDNPKAYLDIMQQDLEYFITKSVRVDISNDKGARGVARHTDDIIYDVVTALKLKFDHFFVCSDYDKKVWYEFTGNRWVKDDGDVSLKRKIREDLYDDFIHVSNKYKRLSERNHPNKQKYEITAKEIRIVANRLRSSKFRESCLREAIEQFYWHRERAELFESDKFEEILNTKTQLIGMKNGVYDLELGQFRESRCEDYLTLSTDIDYYEYGWTDKVIDEIRTFMSQILPEREVREYVLQVLSSFLEGDVRHEHFHIWVGSGGNGKSKLIDLFEYAFGKYCAKLPVSALTGKRASASAPQPEIARLVGKRFVVLQEPNENERIQVGIMKEYTGGDKITVRTLNKEPIEFKPQFKMVLTCNKLPKVPADDGGTWRRIRVVEFKSEFKENPDPEKPNEFPLDPHLNEKLKKWAKPFFWLLTQYHKDYRKKGYNEPEEVMARTRDYRDEHDVYGEFISSNLEKNENSIINLDELYQIFVYWHKKTLSDKPPTRKEFQKNMERKIGAICMERGKKLWRGYKMIEDENLHPHSMYYDGV